MNVIKTFLMLILSISTAAATFINDNLLTKIYELLTITTDDYKKLVVKIFFSLFTAIVLFCLQLLIDRMTFSQIYKKQLADIHKSLEPKNSLPVKLIQKLLSQFNEEVPIEFETFCNKYIGAVRGNKRDNFKNELGKINEFILRKTSLIDEILIDTDLCEQKLNCKSKAN